MSTYTIPKGSLDDALSRMIGKPDTGLSVATIATIAVANDEKNINHWLEPELITAKLESMPYPVDALPEVIRLAINEVHGFVKAPYPLVASCAISALSLAIQTHADIERAKRLKGAVSIFSLSIAESGERKTTCDGFFTQAIRDYDREQAEIAKPLLKDYASEIARWEAQRSGILSAIKTEAGKEKKNTVNGRNLNDDLKDLERNKPEPPRVPHLMLGDETPESLVWRLAKEWPSAGIISSEAGSILGAHGMGKDSVMRNLATLNTLWDGGSISIGRRTSESFVLDGARLTVSLQIQESTLKAFFDKSGGLARGTGFLARFLVAWPDSTQGSRKFSEAPDSWPRLSAFNRRISAILNMQTPINENGNLEPVLLEFTPEAKADWISFHDELEEELRPAGEMFDVRDVASKTADNAARLATLFHVFEYGTDTPVGVDSFRSGSTIALWHLTESRRFFGELALPDEMSNAAKLDDWLLKYCKREKTLIIKRGDIQRLGPIRKKDVLDQTLKDLEEMSRLKTVDTGKRRDIYINPSLFETV